MWGLRGDPYQTAVTIGSWVRTNKPLMATIGALEEVFSPRLFLASLCSFVLRERSRWSSVVDTTAFDGEEPHGTAHETLSLHHTDNLGWGPQPWSQSGFTRSSFIPPHSLYKYVCVCVCAWLQQFQNNQNTQYNQNNISHCNNKTFAMIPTKTAQIVI